MEENQLQKNQSPEVQWQDNRLQHVTVRPDPNNSNVAQTLEALTIGPSPENAPTILLLHEGLGCVKLWRDFPAQLSQTTGLGVLSYSRCGYGSSSGIKLPRPLDYMSQEAASSLPAMIEAFNLDKVILLGHSDGASIAGIYAGSLADARVRGLILMAPHFFTETSGLESIAESLQAYKSGDLRKKLEKYHDNVDMAFLGWNTAWLDPGFRAWNITENIGHWRVPVLAIQGRDDQYGTLEQIRVIEERCPAPVEVALLDDCQHAPHLQQPEKTLSAVKGFLDTLSVMEGFPLATNND